jgi:hypothetical protein
MQDEFYADADPSALHDARAASPDGRHVHKRRSAVPRESGAGSGTKLIPNINKPAEAGPPLIDPYTSTTAPEPRRMPMSLSLLSKKSDIMIQSAGMDAHDESNGADMQTPSFKQPFESLQMGAELARLAAQAIHEPLSRHEEEGVQILTQVRPQIPQQPRCAGWG